MWRDHIDPDRRDDALGIVDDELGYPWLTWRGRRLAPADVQRPGETSALGILHERIRAGMPPETRFDDELPRDYWDTGARAERLEAMGVDEAVAFPNFGLLWERTLDDDLASAHREHDRVEPVVRARGHRRARQGASRRARLAARRAVASRRARRAWSATVCSWRWSRPRSSTGVRCRIPITTRSGARSSSTECARCSMSPISGDPSATRGTPTRPMRSSRPSTRCSCGPRPRSRAPTSS